MLTKPTPLSDSPETIEEIKPLAIGSMMSRAVHNSLHPSRQLALIPMRVSTYLHDTRGRPESLVGTCTFANYAGEYGVIIGHHDDNNEHSFTVQLDKKIVQESPQNLLIFCSRVPLGSSKQGGTV